MASTGPGGQNVNKVATTAILHFDILHSTHLSEKQRENLPRLAGKKIDRDGTLTIIARRYRSQDLNRKDAIERLEELVRKANKKEKKRYLTKPTSSSVKRRLESKKIRGKIKKTRKTRELMD